MPPLRSIDDAVTLQFDVERCSGCGLCVAVCPRAVFVIADARASLAGRGACIECGACALKCAPSALSVAPGSLRPSRSPTSHGYPPTTRQ